MPIFPKEERDDKDDFYKRIQETRNRVFLTKSEDDLKREEETKKKRNELYAGLIKHGSTPADALKRVKEVYGE